MKKLLSVIILVEYEIGLLNEIIQSAKSLFPYEIIIVINEKRNINKKTLTESGVKCIRSDSENMRVIGAKEAKGDILLFLDDSNSISACELKQFMQPAIKDNADVVLNNLHSFFIERQKKEFPGANIIWRQIINEVLGANELKINSLLSLPNIITKKALQEIKYETLKNPVLAQIRLIEEEKKFSCHYFIETQLAKEFCLEERALNERSLVDIEKKNMNKHLVAMAEWLMKTGIRGMYHDVTRNRKLVNILKKHNTIPFSQKGWGIQSQKYNGKQLSVIIPAQNEEATIGQVICEVRKIEPLEIIVVVNGSTDNTANVATQLGATVITYKNPLGHDVGRAIGTVAAKGDILLFLDGDLVVSAKDLYPFPQAIADGCDVALNDLNPFLCKHFPLHIVTLFKYALNLACDRKDLGVGSLTAIPHAISKQFINDIGWDILLCPSVAQVNAILNDYKIECVHYVDVIKNNRLRPNENVVAKGISPTISLILGDHLEGFSYLLNHSKM
ncbi:glycosyltransferase family 2 protein [Bacillus bombysepticus]